MLLTTLQQNLAAGSSDKVDVYWLEIEPTSAVTLSPPLVTNSSSFFAATVTPGAIALTPALFTNTNSFFAATLTRGAVALSPSLFTNTNSFFAATVTTGAVTLTPALFTNSNTFYSATVSQGGSTQTLSPPLVNSAPFSSRPALLLHMDGTNGSTVVVDDSSYAASITNINSATLTTADKQFGTASLDMTRGLTVNGDIERFKWAGDYTVDMWIKTSAWGNRSLFTMTDGPGFSQYVFGMNASGGLQLSSAYVSSASSKSADGIVPLNTWAHVQIARSGTTSRIWLNGTIVSTFSESGSYASVGLAIARVQIGEYVSNEPFVGKMDEVRVLSGEAANTTNFTPPTAAYDYTPSNFYPATVTVGAVTLSPALFTNTNSFYAHTLTTTAPSQTLTATLFTNSNSFYSHVATTSITLAPALFTNDNSFYSHAISTSAASLVASLYTNVNTFFGGALFAANLADGFSRDRVVYVPAENTTFGAAVSVNRTVYVVEEAAPSTVVVSASRTAYVPAEYV